MIEDVPAGRGDVALVADLFGAAVRAELVHGVRTSFRFHRCAVVREIESFSAASWRKKRPDPGRAGGGPAKGRR